MMVVQFQALLADVGGNVQKLLTLFIRMIGILLLGVGIVAAYYGPLEIFVFYLFSEGGQFYYDGFGVGSFWFAALVVQNIGYYVIAALCLPVGIGHVQLRRWALTLTRLYLWFWLGAGILFIGNAVWLIPSLSKLGLSRDTLLLQLSIVGTVLFFFLILLPALALWFYHHEKVVAIFTAHDSQQSWTEKYPFLLLALLLLFVILIIVLHIAIFFQGVFPLFGRIQFGRPSAYLIALCILILAILIYGTVRLKQWAWWGSLVFVSLLTISSVMTFSGVRLYEIILMMNLPAYEMELLEKMVVLHDLRLTWIVVVPLLIALGLIISSKRYFAKGDPHV